MDPTAGAEQATASAEQIKALVRSHAAGDNTRFYAVAMKVAAKAARSGHGKFAQELRELIDRIKAGAAGAPPRVKPVPLAQPRGELAGLLTVEYPRRGRADVGEVLHALEVDPGDRLVGSSPGA